MSRFSGNTFGYFVLLFVLYRHFFFSSFIFLPASVRAYSTAWIRYPYFIAYDTGARLFFSILDYAQNLSFLFFCTRSYSTQIGLELFFDPCFFCKFQGKINTDTAYFFKVDPYCFCGGLYPWQASADFLQMFYPKYF